MPCTKKYVLGLGIIKLFCYPNSMRYFIAFLLCFAAPLSMAQNNHYRSVNDFSNTYEINIRKGTSDEMAKCQAVRLSKDWYITAAHCLKPICDNACDIRVRLIVGPTYEMDTETSHNFSEPAMFLHERANVDKKVAEYDIALIHFKPSKTKIHYTDPGFNPRPPLKLEEFLERLYPYQHLYRQALEGTNIPPILAVETKTPKMLKGTLSVISIWDGDKSVLNSYGPVFYSPALHYIYTENFGIRQGISGSGVMLTSGELVGIVSSTAEIVTVVTDDTTNQKRQANLSFMASFDGYVLDFIKRHIQGLTYKKAGIAQLTIVPDEHRPTTDSMEKVS